MSETTHRVLRLLGLLPSRAVWTGDELAERLGVTVRTVRRDIARVRELGYRVDSVQGVAGGYRIANGSALPPLVLDGDEAFALAACLRVGALDGSDRIGEAALRAETKLSAVLPAATRREVAAFTGAVESFGGERPEVDWQVLSLLARAQRDHRLVRLHYTSSGQELTERDVEPHRLFTSSARWYLIAFDRLRDDWRLFRVDRITSARALTFSFRPREAPSPREMLLDRRPESWRCEAIITLDCPADEVRRHVPGRYFELLGDEPCTLRVGAHDADDLAWHLVRVSRRLGAALQVVEGEELCAALRRLADQVRAATEVDATPI